jgi:hypothetical protein
MNTNNQETSENFHLQEIEGINKTNYELQNRRWIQAQRYS